MTRAIVVKRQGSFVVAAQGAALYSSLLAQTKASQSSAAASAAAALAAAGVGEYADTSAGLAVTDEGETFWVDQGDGTGIIYRHDAGPVATEIGKFVKDQTAPGAAPLLAGGVPTSSDLASTDSDKGAALVGFRGSTAAAVLSSSWSLFENLSASQRADATAGVIGDDLTSNIMEMLSDSVLRDLTFPRGLYKVSGDASATECLLLERNISLHAPAGQMNTRIIGYMPGNTTGAVLRIKMAGSGDVRNWSMRGLGIYPEPSVGGKDGLLIADDGLPMLTCLIEECLLGRNPTNSGRVAVFGYAWAHSILRGSTLSGGVLCECGDANLFQKNLSFGGATEFAYTFDLVEGVRNNTIDSGTIVNQGGTLHVIDGQEIRLINNQCEQAGGVNGNPVSAMVWLEGATRPVSNTLIEKNNFGGGTNYQRSVYIDNADHTIIQNANRFIAPGQDSIGGNADIYLTADATNTIIGSDNKAIATAFSPRRNRVTPVKTIDAGVGTIGSYRTDLSLANGWTCSGFWKDTNGALQFRSGFSGGTTAGGDVMCTLPEGYWPAQQFDATRRNLVDTTSDFSTTSWVRSGITVTAAQGDAPNGRNEYQLVAATAATAVHLFRDDGSNLANTNEHHATFYIERTSGATANVIRFRFYHGTAGQGAYTAKIDLTAGTLSGVAAENGAVASATVTAAGSGWRVDIDYTPVSTGLHYLAFTPGDQSSVTNSYLGDPAVNNFLLWGPQVEEGGAATAYQAVYSATLFSTQMFDITVPVMTSAGAGSVTVSQSGVMKVGTLPAADAVLPPIQSDLVS